MLIFLNIVCQPVGDINSSGCAREDAAAFKTAIQSGTIEIQNASEIDGLKVKARQTFIPNLDDGAGYDTAAQTAQNPTDDVKTAIESHHAMSVWTGDHGEVYQSGQAPTWNGRNCVTRRTARVELGSPKVRGGTAGSVAFGMEARL